MAKVSTCASCGKADLGFLFQNWKLHWFLLWFSYMNLELILSFSPTPHYVKMQFCDLTWSPVRFFHDESPTVEEVRTSSKQASIFRMPLNIVQKPAAKPWCNEQNEMWVLVFSLHYDRISSEVTPVHVLLSSIQTRLLFQSVTYMNNKYFTFHF